MTETFSLILNNAAKSVGGDKYSYTDTKQKISFIYVPQQYSREVKVKVNVKDNLTLTISTDSGSIVFKLLKKGKTGDDRYTPEDETLWKGDVYIDHKFRNDDNKIYLTIT